uniref:Kelch like family member 10 n=1 Tax=Leptobrachium leishanense TaxID=445787 RepID=A0A8C5PFK1_9ANUR
MLCSYISFRGVQDYMKNNPGGRRSKQNQQMDISWRKETTWTFASSHFLRALFTSNLNNQEKKVYNIPGVSANEMKLIIEYAYTRTVPVTVYNVEQLMIAADQFNIKGIVRECCEFLRVQLCGENCIGIWKFTEFYYSPKLHQEALMYILHNFEEIVKVSKEFLELSLDELQAIIEKDELNIKHEETVFEAILKWIDHNPSNRSQYISLLLTKVRLTLLQADYLMNNVKSNSYVKESKESKPIIIKAFKAMHNLSVHRPVSLSVRETSARPRLPFTILFAIGGWSSGSPTSAIESYDSRADQWVKVTCEDEEPKAYHGLVYLKDFIYVIGGFDSVEYFNSVKRFHPVSKTWQEVAPMHSKRCYVSVAVLDRFIYAMGGFDGYVRLSNAECYDPDTNQWTLIAPMNEQRSDASATTLGRKIYICGGFNGTECLSTAEFYNPETNQWIIIHPMRSRRSGVGVIAYGDHVYAVGGFDGSNRLRSAECYSPVMNNWSIIPSMYNPRSNFGIEILDDMLFVVGGFNGFSTTFNAECFDEKNNEWYDVCDMNIYRSALSCCVVPGLPNVREYAAHREQLTLRNEEQSSTNPPP